MKKVLPILCNLRFMLFLVLACVLATANNRSFYTKQYEKNETREATGMSRGDLDRATDLLLDYLSGKRDDLELSVAKNGVPRQLFNEREKAHMRDVKVLYRNAQFALMFLWFAFVLTWVIILKKYRSEFVALMLKGYKVSLIFALLLVGIMAASFAFGFNSFWNGLHGILFSNDLWLLDPSTSTMINMFPLPFWQSMCLRITITFSALFALEYLCYKLLAFSSSRSAGYSK